MSVTTISPRQLADLCESGRIDLLDVRTPVEFRELHAAHASNVPLDRLDPAAVMQARNGSKEEPLYLICRSGSRGWQACEKFLAAGFTNVVNVEGGTLAWAECGLPVLLSKCHAKRPGPVRHSPTTAVEPAHLRRLRPVLLLPDLLLLLPPDAASASPDGKLPPS
jgi:rhodanese-related sulfurtransferase